MTAKRARLRPGTCLRVWRHSARGGGDRFDHLLRKIGGVTHLRLPAA